MGNIRLSCYLNELLFDSHIHLTDSVYDDYLNTILTNMRFLAIKACSVTVDLSSSMKALSIIKNNRDIIFNFVGIHPEYVNCENIEEFESFVISNIESINGIGEIGIDQSYCKLNNENTIQLQRSVFHKMLELAEKFKKPVSIHSRNSLDDVLEILNTFNIGNVCLHWFEGTPKELLKSLDKNYYVSFSPVVVYSKNKKNLLKLTDKNKFLIETDGPVRYSRCFSNIFPMPNSILISVVKSVSETLELSTQDTIDLILKNSKTFFL